MAYTPEQVQAAKIELARRELQRRASTQQPPQSTDMFEQAGMTFSPEDAAAHPYANAINKTGRDVYAMAYPYANQMLSNNPRAALESQGLESPKVSQGEPYTDIAQATQNAGGVAGMIQNPLNRLAGGQVLSKAGALRTAGAGALAGGAYGTVNPEDRITNAALSGVLSVGGGAVAKGVGNIRKYVMNSVPFLRKVQGAFQKSADIATQKFGDALKHLETIHPTSRVNLTPVVKELDNLFYNTKDPKVTELALRSPLLKKLLLDPTQASNLTLTEAQEIKNQLTRESATATDLAIYRFMDSIDSAMEKGYPDIKGVRADYRDYMVRKEEVGKAIAEGGTKSGKGLEAALQNKFHGKIAEESAGKLLQEVADSSPEFSNIRKEILAYRRTNKTLQGAAKMGSLAAKVLAAAGVGGALYGLHLRGNSNR